MQDILQRIDQRIADLGTSATAVSRKASGSTELIRNWKRRVKSGDTEFGAYQSSFAAVADALGVTESWLLRGVGTRDAPAPAPGFHDGDITPYTAPEPTGLAPSVSASQIARALAPHLRSLQIYTLNRSFPTFSLKAGDLLIAEAQHRARHGDTVIVNFDEHQAGNPVMLLRRFQPPWLISLEADEPNPVIILDDGRAPIIATVEAMWRIAAAPQPK